MIASSILNTLEEKSLMMFKSLALGIQPPKPFAGFKYALHFCLGMIEEDVEETLIFGG